MFALASVASFNKALSGGGYGPLMTSGLLLGGLTVVMGLFTLYKVLT